MREIFSKSIDSNYETWPDLFKSKQALYCGYSETIEEEKRAVTTINCVYSTDGGATWNSSNVPIEKKGVPFWHKVRFLKNDTQKVILFAVLAENTAGFGEIVYLHLNDEFKWSDIIYTGIYGILSGNPIMLTCGRVILQVHKLNKDTGYFQQYVWFSDDLIHWQQSDVIFTLPNCDFLDAEVIEVTTEEVLMLIRESTPNSWDLYKSISRDRGLTWSVPEKVPFRGGQNPSAGIFFDKILITFSMDLVERTNKSVAIAWVDKDAFMRNHKIAKFNILHSHEDTYRTLGYSSWVEIDEKRIYVSEYILKGSKGTIVIKEVEM